MVFFLGAGASRPAPACLPQPPTIQKAAFDCVAPAKAVGDLPLIEGAVPEVYHEVLLDFGGDATREIWKVLSAWESPASPLSGFSLGPNLVHLLVVYLSWKGGTPVLTVNFDRMLERAAIRLGLHPETRLGRRATGDSVAIWKLHGSVDDTSTIRTTLQGITATNPRLLDSTQDTFTRATGCLIGYSGNDIDFFPFLCGWENVQRPIYWLSLNLDKTAIERSPYGFLGLDEPAEAWARQVIERLPSATDERVRQLKAELNRPLPATSEVDRAYRAVVEDTAKRIYRATFSANDPKRLLAHATALAALGKNHDAERWLDAYMEHAGNASLDCRAHLLRSALAHEFARYEDSREHAQLAFDLARERDMPESADQALLRIDEANRMLYVPPRLPIARSRAILGVDSLATIARMLLHAWTLRRWRKGPSAENSMARPRELRATFEYLEHLVRVAAIAQGLSERLLPSRFAEMLFAPWWRYLERRCYAAGYTFGIGNSKKYRLRRVPLEARKRSELSVLDLYSLVPSPTGSSIHHRDIADVAAAQMRKASGDERNRKREEALEHYEEAIDNAVEAGDPSLELKAMFGLQVVEPERKWPRDRVRRLVGRIQGPAYAKLADRIVARLAA